MKAMNHLFYKKGIQGITIVDLRGEILFTVKFNKKFNEHEPNYEVVGKNFFEVYENLNKESSTMFQAMEKGVPIYVEDQTLKPKGREPVMITSLSIPLKSGSQIVGAIDLSALEMEEREEYEIIDLKPELFQRDYQKAPKSDNSARYTLEDIITEDEKMLRMKEYIKVAAANDMPALIYGETGTGKELIAHAMHNLSSRKDKPFVAQNCAAIPENLLESILFGTAKGAFTGAQDNIGLFELVNGGTLFLDELNSMPSHLQSKLLRVLQDGEFRSVGSNVLKKVDIKFIAAMNKEPVDAIEQGELRQDIYYRMGVFRINIPPLSDRKGDIPLLVNHFVQKYNVRFGRNVKYVSNLLYDKLQEYGWPGNVRELEHVIIYGLTTMEKDGDKLKFAHIEDKYNEVIRLDKGVETSVTSLRKAVDAYERELIRKALAVSNFNITQAARLLDIPRQTLQRKGKEYNLI